MVYPGVGLSHRIRTHSGNLDMPDRSPTFAGEVILEQVFANLPREHRFRSLTLATLKNPQTAQGRHTRFYSGAQRSELLSLVEESDPELFYLDLLAFAQSHETQDPVLAQSCYQTLSTDLSELAPVPETIATAAAHHQVVLLGGGSLGDHLERLTPLVLDEALAPEGLMGMAAGGLAFRGIRSGSYLALNSLPRATWWNRGLAARSLATLTGFMAEAPTFTLTSHGLRSAWGHPTNFPGHGLGDQILSGYIMLGALRSFGGVFHRVSASQAMGQNALARFSRVAMPQAGIALGLMASQGVEIAAGRRELGPWQGHFAEILGTLFQFHVAGRLLPQVMGSRYRRLESQLEIPWRLEPSWGKFSEWMNGRLSHLPVLAHVGPGPGLAPASGTKIFVPWVAMASHDRSPGAQIPLELAPLERPDSVRRPRSTPTPPATETFDTPTLPNGRGLLPQGGPQLEILSVTEGNPLGPQDAALRQQMFSRLRASHLSNPQATLHGLKPILADLAREQDIALDVFLGRALSRANALEVEGALSLLRNPRQPGPWFPEHDIAWITQHQLKGGIPRLGSLAQEIGSVGALAREAMVRLAPQHPAEVYREIEVLLKSSQSLVQWNGLNLATQISHRGMLSQLRNLAYGSNPMTHRIARNALLNLHDATLAPHFRKTLDNPRADWSEKAWAAYGLGRLGHLSEAAPILSELARSSRSQTRFEAARGLIRLQLSGTIPSTLNLIKGMTGRELLTLTQDCLTAGYRNHAEFLLHKTLQLPENGIQVEALDLIATHQLQNLRTAVEKLRESPYPEFRWSAAETQLELAAARGDRRALWQGLDYAEVPAQQEPSHFRLRREASQLKIQIAAATHLATPSLHPRERALVVRRLNQTLDASVNGRFQLAAAKILTGPLQHSQGHSQLRRLLNHSDPMVRAEAARTLNEMAPGWDGPIHEAAKRIRYILTEHGVRFGANSGE